MKTKSKHRWLALFMVVAMLIGTLPITSIRRRQHAYRRLLCEGRGSALHNRRIGGAYPYGRLRLSRR